MQAVGNKFFPGPALTYNQYRFIQRCQMRNLLQHFNKAVRFTQKIIFVSSHDEIHHLLVLFTNLR
ncbi:Uncharacterised protein [Klebsiella pneumoniae]|nr:Uncharacterised protein [Klebsiella pneumoniae]